LSLPPASTCNKCQGSSDVQMTEVRKSLVCTAALVFALAPHSTFSQDAGSENGVQHFGIAAKRPVFAGACKACPWGILASVTAQALRYYGYDTQICWVCWSNFGPREMARRAGLDTTTGRNVPDFLNHVSGSNHVGNEQGLRAIAPNAGTSQESGHRFSARLRRASDIPPWFLVPRTSGLFH
jgi:hypothetical protein